MAEHVVGVDGGNSKTDVVVASTSGRVLARRRGPGVVSPLPDPAGWRDRLASLVEQTRRDAGIRTGLRVRLLGFVSGSPDVPAGTFEVARFYVACCIADAQPVGVPVAADRSFRRDTWLDVTGTLERRGRRFVVRVQRIEHASQPSQPYLSFRT